MELNTLLTQIFIASYIIITFAYSAIEKIVDWNASVLYYKNHFRGTLLKNTIPFLLKIVIVLEILSVLFLIIGIYLLYFFQNNTITIYGYSFAAITLISLMLGQRIAKDYTGATHITIYFILTVLGLFLL